MGIDFLQPKGIDNFSDFGIRFVSGVNEFVDNAIEAKAKNIMITLKTNGDSVDVIIIEDGQGMDGKTLQYAMSFGGEDAGVKSKQATDIGKFHAGITIASLSLSNHCDVFSNNGDGWVKNYLDKEEIKKTKKIYPSEECELPNEIISILEDARREKGLDIELKTGTVIVLKKLDKEIIGPSNFDLEVEQLFNNSCIRYHNYLANEGSIYIMVNNAKDTRNCEPIHPLLKNDKLLEQNGLEIFANFKYENVLTIKEVFPYSKLDGSMDIEFVLIRKINKNGKMVGAHDLVKMDMENQGSYFGRNNLNIIRAENIGYNKKHNSLNGARTYSNLDGKWDTILGINVNKSLCNPNSKFYELLNERLKKIYVHLRKVLTVDEKLNPPIIEIVGGRKCEPEILKDLTKEKENKTNDTQDNPNGKDSGKNSNENTDNDTTNNDTNTNDNNAQNCLKKNEIKTSIKLDGRVPIIFAAKGKPNLKVNMGNGAVNLSEDNKNYYIYDKEINSLGVRKADIEEWCLENRISEDEFYNKLKKSIRKDAEAQVKFYEYYMKHIYNDTKKDFFLFPEVYVNVNMKSWDLESKQCIDFMMILPNKEKVIIEIDGIGHYANENKGKWYADSNKFSVDRKFDREMQFQGYKVFRFGNVEINNDISVVEEFFKELFK